MTMLDPHLDVDQLSAAVDGLADEATSTHLSTCLACQEQVEVWRRSLGQLKNLPAVEAPAPDDAIAAALAEWTPPGAAPVTPISADRSSRRRWRPSASLISVVAAIAIVFGISIAVIHAGGGGSSKSSSSGFSSAAGASSGASTSSGTSGASSSGSSSGGSSAAASTGNQGTLRMGKNANHATAATPITTSRKAVLSAALKSYTAGKAKETIAASTPCLKEAKVAAVKDAGAVAGGPVAPSYLVSVTYRGVQSQAFVFTRSVGYVAFVLKDGTCALVTSLDF